ncbi:MAG TPA: hypothetical protein DC047_09100, partial [Blastocatellia bacterium]|nr:hypothetical protein [Blastocatellia bacterium]
MPDGVTAAVFHRSGNTNLFWSGDADLVRRLAFLSSGALTGNDVSLSQTWSDGSGVYVIFGATVPDDGKDALLEVALRQFLGWKGWPAL